ncbi:SIR2 family protein [Rhizobium ruizarguesonis]
MEKLQQLLQNGRNGSAVLFCGAGFTADCLNFDQELPLGVTFHLLEMINSELKKNGKQSGYKDIRNAAKRVKTDIGNHRLMELLKARFHLSRISSSIETIAEYPWSSVYTTNYDNGLELALQGIRKKYTPCNNLDDPNTPVSGLPVIHLHGFAEVWTDETFEQSCILDADSYRHLSGVRNWLERLRFDIERAEIVVFLGFSAADFHLSQVLFNVTGLQKKAYFINHPTASPDPDERATQEDFGEALYIGREAFADQISRILQLEAPTEPRLASFERFLLPNASQSVPPVADIEDLFIWGKINSAHVKRDWDLEKSDYHIIRSEVVKVVEHLNTPGNIAILHGDICDGKSLSILGAMTQIASGRPVFQMKHFYSDLLNEVSSILATYPDAVLVIESCFTLREDRLLAVVRQISAGAGGLLLSTRSIATEAESSKFRALKSVPSVLDIRLSKIQGREVEELSALIDQIAGWREFGALSPGDRRRFIERECDGILPSILLKLLNSKYVRDKYRAEYNKISGIDAQNRSMIIAALIITGIGLDTPVSLISDIFENDFVSTIDKLAVDSNGLRLIRVDGDTVRTVPSIGARNILAHVIDDKDIVNSTIFVLEQLNAKYRKSELENYIFTQLMRYSILSSVVDDDAEVDRFFDHISKVSYFREMPLFWLQWHMAMAAQLRWLKAEEYLEMGYTAADAFEKKRGEKYIRKQLEDRKAKFLTARAAAGGRVSVELFRDMKEAVEIVGRLMRDSELTHHPYETLLQIVKVVDARGTTIPTDLIRILTGQLKEIIGRAKGRVGVVPEGYQRIHAEGWIRETETLAAAFI